MINDHVGRIISNTNTSNINHNNIETDDFFQSLLKNDTNVDVDVMVDGGQESLSSFLLMDYPLPPSGLALSTSVISSSSLKIPSEDQSIISSSHQSHRLHLVKDHLEKFDTENPFKLDQDSSVPYINFNFDSHSHSLSVDNNDVINDFNERIFTAQNRNPQANFFHDDSPENNPNHLSILDSNIPFSLSTTSLFQPFNGSGNLCSSNFEYYQPHSYPYDHPVDQPFTIPDLPSSSSFQTSSYPLSISTSSHTKEKTVVSSSSCVEHLSKQNQQHFRDPFVGFLKKLPTPMVTSPSISGNKTCEHNKFPRDAAVVPSYVRPLAHSSFSTKIPSCSSASLSASHLEPISSASFLQIPNQDCNIKQLPPQHLQIDQSSTTPHHYHLKKNPTSTKHHPYNSSSSFMCQSSCDNNNRNSNPNSFATQECPSFQFNGGSFPSFHSSIFSMPFMYPPKTPLTSEQIQALLDENRELINTAHEYQNLGRVAESLYFQARLHSNMTVLANLADKVTQNQRLMHPLGKRTTTSQSKGTSLRTVPSNQFHYPSSSTLSSHDYESSLNNTFKPARRKASIKSKPSVGLKNVIFPTSSSESSLRGSNNENKENDNILPVYSQQYKTSSSVDNEVSFLSSFGGLRPSVSCMDYPNCSLESHHLPQSVQGSNYQDSVSTPLTIGCTSSSLLEDNPGRNPDINVDRSEFDMPSL